MMNRIKAYGELCKIRIALLSAFSAITGFLLSSAGFRPQMIMLLAGVFLLACGSSVLNQYQEIEIDALMPRTMSRPLPSKRIRPVNALFFSISLLFSGFSSLLLTGSLTASLLGLFAIGWYNGVYTLLKRKSAFAVIPGALIGAIPPAIGWVAAGGMLRDPRLLLICFFFFIWQVPHFWLLMMDYGREYERAGLPSMTEIFTAGQMKRIVFIWISATAVSCLFLSASGVIRYFFINAGLLALSSWLIWNGIKSLLAARSENLSMPVFKKINLYMFLVMLLLSTDKIVEFLS